MPCAPPASATPSPCPGESFLGLLEGLRDAGIRVIATRHEGGAAFMAEAHGQLTGRPAVALGTRAVGAANLAIGIHTARQDSAPMFVLVGQVERGLRGREAFQEIDQAATIGGLAPSRGADQPRRDCRRPSARPSVRRSVGGPGPAYLSRSRGPDRRGAACRDDAGHLAAGSAAPGARRRPGGAPVPRLRQAPADPRRRRRAPGPDLVRPRSGSPSCSASRSWPAGAAAT